MIRFDYAAMGNRVRIARKKLHMTQSKLADITGLSVSHIGHIERGSRIPSIETLVNLCYALNLPADDLLYDSYPENKFRTHFPRAIMMNETQPLLQNTLTNWVLGDPPLSPSFGDMPVDLNKLPPLKFMQFEEDDVYPDTSDA